MNLQENNKVAKNSDDNGVKKAHWQFWQEKPHFSYLLVWLATGVIVGDICALVFQIKFLSNNIFLVLGIGNLILAILIKDFLRLVFIFLAGMILMLHKSSFYNIDLDNWIKLKNQVVTVSGKIIEDPDREKGKCKIKINDLEIMSSKKRGILFITTQDCKETERDDRLIINGRLSEGFGMFFGMVKEAKIIKISKPKYENPILTAKNNFAEKIKNYIRPPNSSLALGYLIGIKSDLPKKLANDLQIIGLTHIVVASGANLSILVNFVRKMFGKLSRLFSLLLAILCILGFAVAVGFSASMSRACIVSLAGLVAWYFGRKWIATRLIILTASATLFLQPYYLMDLGWMLSFGAFLGIMVCGPIITEYFYDEKPRLLAQTLLESLSATIICLPILIFFFGGFSVLSVLANVLVLPTISIVMGLVFLTGMLDFLPMLAGAIGIFASLILEYHILIINYFGEQKSFYVQTPKNQIVIFLVYLPIIVMLLYMKRKNAIIKK